jgi:hypothetical protein
MPAAPRKANDRRKVTHVDVYKQKKRKVSFFLLAHHPVRGKKGQVEIHVCVHMCVPGGIDGALPSASMEALRIRSQSASGESSAGRVSTQICLKHSHTRIIA